MSKQQRIISVIGAGQMGSGIAQVAAQCGAEVYLFDESLEAKTKSQNIILKSLTKLAEKNQLQDTAQVVQSRIHYISNLQDIAKANPEIVIEAIVENADIKKNLYKHLDQILPPSCIFASNTSSISITELAAKTKRADKFIGMHFMNPVPLMKLVEVIEGLATSRECFEYVKSLAEEMGKSVVVSKDMPGFIVNRILMPMINEACFALSEGLATADDIDTAMRLGTNQPMGPLQLADFIGLDTCLYIMEVLHHGLGDSKYRPSPLLRQYVAAGFLGRKNKRGFYKYE